MIHDQCSLCSVRLDKRHNVLILYFLLEILSVSGMFAHGGHCQAVRQNQSKDLPVEGGNSMAVTWAPRDCKCPGNYAANSDCETSPCVN